MCTNTHPNTVVQGIIQWLHLVVVLDIAVKSFLHLISTVRFFYERFFSVFIFLQLENIITSELQGDF